MAMQKNKVPAKNGSVGPIPTLVIPGMRRRVDTVKRGLNASLQTLKEANRSWARYYSVDASGEETVDKDGVSITGKQVRLLSKQLATLADEIDEHA